MSFDTDHEPKTRRPVGDLLGVGDGGVEDQLVDADGGVGLDRVGDRLLDRSAFPAIRSAVAAPIGA
jgi:hypothetical protein